MKQLHLPGLTPPQQQVVNVASVKHRSPFRYPGGKTWLVPRARQWLTSLPEDRRRVLLEPFAGGAIVGLSAAFEQLAAQVILVELDDQVADVWNAIITANDGEWLAKRIIEFEINRTTVNSILEAQNLPPRERAFRTILKNRVNRGGILAKGAGKLKHGENGKGIASRWYAATLAARIYDLVSIRERLSFVHGDGLQVLQHYSDRSDVVFFIDPPYTAGGKKPGRRLYDHSELDHEKLFQIVNNLCGDFLMTYDAVDAITEIASRYEFDTRIIPMKNTHHSKKNELLIGRDLAWFDGPAP